MCLQLQFSHDVAGLWLLTGLPRHQPARFRQLADGLDYAKRECAAAPAVIELLSDGIYVVAYQSEGWPNRLCRPRQAGGLARAGATTARLGRWLGDVVHAARTWGRRQRRGWGR